MAKAQAEVELTADKSKMARELKSAQGDVKRFGQRTSEAATAIRRSFIGAFAITHLQQFFSTALKEIDAFHKGAIRVGVTAEEYQKVARVLELNGTRMQQVETLFVRLTRRVQEHTSGQRDLTKVFEAMGMKAEDFVGIPLEQKLALLSRGYQNAKRNGAEVAVLLRLLDTEGRSLIPTLEQGEKNILKLADSMQVIDDQSVEKVVKFNNSLTMLYRTLQARVNVPALASASEATLDWSENTLAEAVRGWGLLYVQITRGTKAQQELWLEFEKQKRQDEERIERLKREAAEQRRLNEERRRNPQIADPDLLSGKGGGGSTGVHHVGEGPGKSAASSALRERERLIAHLERLRAEHRRREMSDMERLEEIKERIRHLTEDEYQLDGPHGVLKVEIEIEELKREQAELQEQMLETARQRAEVEKESAEAVKANMDAQIKFEQEQAEAERQARRQGRRAGEVTDQEGSRRSKLSNDEFSRKTRESDDAFDRAFDAVDYRRGKELPFDPNSRTFREEVRDAPEDAAKDAAKEQAKVSEELAEAVKGLTEEMQKETRVKLEEGSVVVIERG